MASFNHTYLLDLAAAAHPSESVLDYGCGRGEAVALGVQRGQDMWGVDTFGGVWAEWRTAIATDAIDRVQPISSGAAPFNGGAFGAIMANQVLEHVQRPAIILDDIHRMLRPGGTFYATLPVHETWFEPHIGLYFPHRLSNRSQRHFLSLMHSLGFGASRHSGQSRAQWVGSAQRNMQVDIFYHRGHELIALMERRFGAPVRDLSLDYMRKRLGARARLVPAALLRQICRARAGLFLEVRKA
ncbi:MAG TPA: class I SAM-dependent methyltransferase [Roseomonas sp.]|jgi:SAM-dependent methyltransferase